MISDRPQKARKLQQFLAPNSVEVFALMVVPHGQLLIGPLVLPSLLRRQVAQSGRLPNPPACIRPRKFE
jgi:hypothetical protein